MWLHHSHKSSSSLPVFLSGVLSAIFTHSSWCFFVLFRIFMFYGLLLRCICVFCENATKHHANPADQNYNNKTEGSYYSLLIIIYFIIYLFIQKQILKTPGKTLYLKKHLLYLFLHKCLSIWTICAVYTFLLRLALIHDNEKGHKFIFK